MIRNSMNKKQDKPERIVLAPASPKQKMVLQDEETDTLLCGGGAGKKLPL